MHIGLNLYDSLDMRQYLELMGGKNGTKSNKNKNSKQVFLTI